MGVCLYVLCFYFSRIEDVCVLVVKFWGRWQCVLCQYGTMVRYSTMGLWDYRSMAVVWTLWDSMVLYVKQCRDQYSTVRWPSTRYTQQYKEQSRVHLTVRSSIVNAILLVKEQNVCAMCTSPLILSLSPLLPVTCCVLPVNITGRYLLYSPCQVEIRQTSGGRWRQRSSQYSGERSIVDVRRIYWARLCHFSVYINSLLQQFIVCLYSLYSTIQSIQLQSSLLSRAYLLYLLYLSISVYSSLYRMYSTLSQYM